MQKKNFKNLLALIKLRYFMSDFTKIANAFGIKSLKISAKNLEKKIKNILNYNGPYICQINIPDFQPLIPDCKLK